MPRLIAVLPEKEKMVSPPLSGFHYFQIGAQGIYKHWRQFCQNRKILIIEGRIGPGTQGSPPSFSLCGWRLVKLVSCPSAPIKTFANSLLQLWGNLILSVIWPKSFILSLSILPDRPRVMCEMSRHFLMLHRSMLASLVIYRCVKSEACFMSVQKVFYCNSVFVWILFHLYCV